ncbi:MAG: NAD(P)/FAD-dependent oxidoreductase [Candidatus Eremiobacteraeota bacterium]|nr:NAD(P)/FAD-dependent oxidoreductase [Candidatus Eremiobacteraeota bacterium]
MERTELLVVGCGPAGGIAAREAAASGLECVVLEKDAVVGAKRVCAAGLRPGFCEQFAIPRTIVHCDPARLALYDESGACHSFEVGPAHTTTREELDGTIGELARHAGADVRCRALYRRTVVEGDRSVVEYADGFSGMRRQISARFVFFANGATAHFEAGPFAFPKWTDGILTCYQHRVYPQSAAAPVAYETLELHYYRTAEGRQVVGWMFPKRDHLAIGLGVIGKIEGRRLRAELGGFADRIASRLYSGVPHTIKEEGHLLYGGLPRPVIASGGAMVGGTAAGLVDATNGEGIYEAALSGRLAAEACKRFRDSATRAANEYARAVQSKFYRRLKRRVALMHFLERKPRRFGALFEQLASTPYLRSLLEREDDEKLTLAQRGYLLGQALRFATRAI